MLREAAVVSAQRPILSYCLAACLKTARCLLSSSRPLLARANQQQRTGSPNREACHSHTAIQPHTRSESGLSAERMQAASRETKHACQSCGQLCVPLDRTHSHSHCASHSRTASSCSASDTPQLSAAYTHSTRTLRQVAPPLGVTRVCTGRPPPFLPSDRLFVPPTALEQRLLALTQHTRDDSNCELATRARVKAHPPRAVACCLSGDSYAVALANCICHLPRRPRPRCSHLAWPVARMSRQQPLQPPLPSAAFQLPRRR